jgi:hypothetical protein
LLKQENISGAEGPVVHNLHNTLTTSTQRVVENQAGQRPLQPVGKPHLRWQHREVTALIKKGLGSYIHNCGLGLVNDCMHLNRFYRNFSLVNYIIYFLFYINRSLMFWEKKKFWASDKKKLFQSKCISIKTCITMEIIENPFWFVCLSNLCIFVLTPKPFYNFFHILSLSLSLSHIHLLKKFLTREMWKEWGEGQCAEGREGEEPKSILLYRLNRSNFQRCQDPF